MALTNGDVMFPAERRRGVTIVVEDRTITGVVDSDDPAGHGEGTRAIDLGGRLVTPGLIDLHVHGGYGGSFDRPDGGTADLLRRFARSGVTSIQASLVSATPADLRRRLDGIRADTTTAPADGAELLGAHLEGPFLAATQRGAHDPAVLRNPTPDDVAAFLAHRDLISMVTLAPELPGALDAIARFVDAGIVVAAGHSEATAADLVNATAAGLSHVTHLWSGQSTTTRCGPWRVPGLLEGSLASTELTAEVVADGCHLPAELLEIARRCLGDRLVVVSDGTPGTGMPRAYRYGLGTVQCEVGDGVGVVVGADVFGGSTSTLARMLVHLHHDLGWPLVEVVAAATTRPASVAGVSDRKGAIAAGMDADLAVFDPGFQPWATVVRGRWVQVGPGKPGDGRMT